MKREDLNEGLMPRAKKPVPDLIFRDDVNKAIAFAEGVSRWSKSEQDAHRGDGQMSLAAGIRSLVAERDMLRKLVKEAYQDGLATCCGNPDQEGRNWEASEFPAKIERPWES